MPKKPSPAQLRARRRFAAMARSGRLRKGVRLKTGAGTPRKNPPTRRRSSKPRRTPTMPRKKKSSRRTFSIPVAPIASIAWVVGPGLGAFQGTGTLGQKLSSFGTTTLNRLNPTTPGNFGMAYAPMVAGGVAKAFRVNPGVTLGNVRIRLF